jgi:hypothetical protein
MENILKKESGAGSLRRRYRREVPSRWKDAGFAALPKSVLFDHRLSKTAIVVFSLLIAYTFEGKKYCYPKQSTLAKEAHASRRSVVTALKELETFGYLEIEHNASQGKANRYFLKAKI